MFLALRERIWNEGGQRGKPLKGVAGIPGGSPEVRVVPGAGSPSQDCRNLDIVISYNAGAEDTRATCWGCILASVQPLSRLEGARIVARAIVRMPIGPLEAYDSWCRRGGEIDVTRRFAQAYPLFGQYQLSDINSRNFIAGDDGFDHV